MGTICVTWPNIIVSSSSFSQSILQCVFKFIHLQVCLQKDSFHRTKTKGSERPLMPAWLIMIKQRSLVVHIVCGIHTEFTSYISGPPIHNDCELITELIWRTQTWQPLRTIIQLSQSMMGETDHVVCNLYSYMEVCAVINIIFSTEPLADTGPNKWALFKAAFLASLLLTGH